MKQRKYLEIGVVLENEYNFEKCRIFVNDWSLLYLGGNSTSGKL